jgi:hypothetical protein
MQDNPGLSVIALANAAGASRSMTGERFQRLAQAGKIEKNRAGRGVWSRRRRAHRGRRRALWRRRRVEGGA